MPADVPTLVLMPGLDGTGTAFGPLLERLGPAVPVVVLRYPPDRLMSIEEHAACAEAGLPRGPFVLLAESFSGLVALTLLREPRPQLRGIIWCAAFAGPPRRLLPWVGGIVARAGKRIAEAPDWVMRHFFAGADATDGQLRLLREAGRAVRPEVIAHRLRLVCRRRTFRVRRDVCPSCYLQASADRLVPPACARWFARRFDRFVLRRIDGPHALLQTRPGPCAAVVKACLADFAAGD